MDSGCGDSCKRSTDLTTAARKVELLQRVMGDPPPQGGDFSDWFIRWLDLTGECEQARGRLIDGDIKVAVFLKRAPRSSETVLCLRVRSWQTSKTSSL